MHYKIAIQTIFGYLIKRNTRQKIHFNNYKINITYLNTTNTQVL